MDKGSQYLWDKWAKSIAAKQIDDLVSPEIADAAAACTELGTEIDDLREQVAALQAEVSALRAQP